MISNIPGEILKTERTEEPKEFIRSSLAGIIREASMRRKFL